MFDVLPANYESLSPEARRQARLAAVADRSTPEKMIGAWNFFRQYYLLHDRAFFYKDFKPSPLLHYELISFTRRYRLNAIAAPRNHAKSTIIGIEYPLMEILSPSIPGMSIGIVLAKDQFVSERFDKIMFQIDNNPRIIEDFGRLRPPKGEGIWNRHQLRLLNNVWLKGYSVDGVKRGDRPDLIIVDDPEYDPAAGTDISKVSYNLETMLGREILGMLSPHSRLFWIGTLIHARSFLARMVKDEEGNYKYWNRRLYSAEAGTNSAGETEYIWGERLTREFMQMQRETMGEGAYRAEYCNDPRSDQDAILSVDPVLNEYHLNNADPSREFLFPNDDPAPLLSRMPIRWHDVTKDLDGAMSTEEKTGLFGDTVSQMSRYMTVDYAQSLQGTADYSAITVFGFDRKNTLWVLDAWQGRVREHDLIRQIWDLGRRWKVKIVGVESVALQDGVRQQVSDFMQHMAVSGQWTPRVVGIRYGVGVTKPDRIGSLEWRFTRGRIKLPSYLQRSNAGMGVLYQQIHDFTPDLSRLAHDDLIDALSMAHTLLKGAGRGTEVKKADPATWGERLLAGELYMKEFPTIPITHAMSPCDLTHEMIAVLERSAGHWSMEHSREHPANFAAPYVDPGDYTEDMNEYNPSYYDSFSDGPDELFELGVRGLGGEVRPTALGYHRRNGPTGAY